MERRLCRGSRGYFFGESHRFGGDTLEFRVMRKFNRFVIDSPRQVGGYPKLATGTPPRDSDHDGMPDSWEQQMGLNPNDPSDSSLSAEDEGYTNIELYLHTLLH